MTPLDGRFHAPDVLNDDFLHPPVSIGDALINGVRGDTLTTQAHQNDAADIGVEAQAHQGSGNNVFVRLQLSAPFVVQQRTAERVVLGDGLRDLVGTKYRRNYGHVISGSNAIVAFSFVSPKGRHQLLALRLLTLETWTCWPG